MRVRSLLPDLLPLEKTYRLWDTLLIAPESFPLHLAVAVMQHVRKLLLPLDFNGCVLFFSNLPTLDMESVINAASSSFTTTPLTVTAIPPPETAGAHDMAARVGASDLSNILANGGIIADARQPALFQRRHIARSVSIHPTRIQHGAEVCNDR